MRIAILTFQNACNFGAVLQAYALQKYLNELSGTQAYILDYAEAVNGQHKPVFDLWKSKGWRGVIRNLLKGLAIGRERRREQRIYRDFHDERYPIRKGEKDLTSQDLPRIAGGYDCYIVGSDQVWNTKITNNDAAYFLDFVPQGIPKYSYAASTGDGQFTKQEMEYCQKMLADYKAVSLREASLVSLLSQALPGIPVAAHVDPVFLLSVQEWRELSCWKPRRDYVLFFSVGNGDGIQRTKQYARRLAAQKQCDLLYLSGMDCWYHCWDLKHFGPASPPQFLGLIDHAQAIVTNSFHGTAFSIIFHKEFYAETETAKPERIWNLLRMTGLTDRALRNGNPIQPPQPTDWETVEALLIPELQRAKEYLGKIAAGADANIKS